MSSQPTSRTADIPCCPSLGWREGHESAENFQAQHNLNCFRKVHLANTCGPQSAWESTSAGLSHQ
jgi:hypothetical protein